MSPGIIDDTMSGNGERTLSGGSATSKTSKFVIFPRLCAMRSSQRGHARRRNELMPQTTEEPLSDILRRSGYFDADGNLRIEFVARDKIMPLAEQMRRAM